MNEYGPNNPFTYRQEIIPEIFKNIQMTESCAIIGPGSMGKTRLLDFLMRLDVRTHFLGNLQDDTIFLRVDCNRMHEPSPWGLFEVMLTTIVESCNEYVKTASSLELFNNLRKPVILEQNDLLAQRQLELTIRVLVKNLGLKICFLLDEFEPIYRDFPAQTMSHLRSLRDQNKYHFSYALFFRNMPEIVRPTNEVESFYELFSRNYLGLGPYSHHDALAMVGQLEKRRKIRLSGSINNNIVILSGGHPGLIQAIFELFVHQPQMVQDPSALKTPLQFAPVLEECRKLLASLSETERNGLYQIIQGQNVDAQIMDHLVIKGLIKNGGVFSPIFEQYIVIQTSEP